MYQHMSPKETAICLQEKEETRTESWIDKLGRQEILLTTYFCYFLNFRLLSDNVAKLSKI